MASCLLFIVAMTNTDVFPVWQGKAGTKSKTEPVPLSDHALALAAGKGDMQAFEMLYERHNRRVYSLCLRMTQNPAEAELNVSCHEHASCSPNQWPAHSKLTQPAGMGEAGGETWHQWDGH